MKNKYMEKIKSTYLRIYDLGGGADDDGQMLLASHLD